MEQEQKKGKSWVIVSVRCSDAVTESKVSAIIAQAFADAGYKGAEQGALSRVPAVLHGDIVGSRVYGLSLPPA